VRRRPLQDGVVENCGREKAQPKVGAGNTSTDEVQLSNLSEQIRSEDGFEFAGAGAAHLQKLSAAIEAGTYRVDATAISRKIIDESTKLTLTQRSDNSQQ